MSDRPPYLFAIGPLAKEIKSSSFLLLMDVGIFTQRWIVKPAPWSDHQGFRSTSEK